MRNILIILLVTCMPFLRQTKKKGSKKEIDSIKIKEKEK